MWGMRWESEVQRQENEVWNGVKSEKNAEKSVENMQKQQKTQTRAVWNVCNNKAVWNNMVWLRDMPKPVGMLNYHKAINQSGFQ